MTTNNNHPLNIAALPLDIVWADRQANLRAVAERVGQVRPDTDIILLPELFTTAFVPEPDLIRQLAETESDMTMQAVRSMASSSRCAIAGSFLACDSGRNAFFNRAFFTEPNGDTVFCDKRHLFGLSPESKLLSPGSTSYATTRFRGWNIALGVCYDLRFPVWCRNRLVALDRAAYDVFLLPANWPDARGYALDTLARARAIENQAYMVVGNRSGSDDYGKYDGATFIVDFMGQPMASSSADDPDGFVYATADSAALAEARRRMPALADADSASIRY